MVECGNCIHPLQSRHDTGVKGTCLKHLLIFNNNKSGRSFIIFFRFSLVQTLSHQPILVRKSPQTMSNDTMNDDTAITWKVTGERNVLTVSEAQMIADEWFSQLDKNPKLKVTTIDLSGRAWPPDALAVLQPVLERVSSTIQHVLVQDSIASLPTELGLASIELWNKLFGQSSNLQTLNLADNALGRRGIKLLEPLLTLPTLQHLSVLNCGLSAEDAQHLVEMDNLTSLRSFNAGRNAIGPEGAPFIGQLVSRNHHLEIFEYIGSRVGVGAIKLLKGLAQLPNATLIKLHMNEGTLHGRAEDDKRLPENDNEPTAPQLLAQIVRQHTTLIDLNLSDDNLEVEGLQLVLPALPPHLESLNLSGSGELESEGGELLATYLKSNKAKQLRTLLLESNELGNEGAALILEALSEGTTQLSHLNLESNFLDADLEFVPLPSLEILNLKDNDELEDVADTIRATFPKAQVLIDSEDQLVAQDAAVQPQAEEEEIDALANELAAAKI